MTATLRTLLVSLCLAGTSLTYAQSVALLAYKDQPEQEQKSLSSALRDLENRYQVRFNYANEVVVNKRVHKVVTNTDNLETSLEKLLSPLDLSYEKVKDNVFFIFRKTQLKKLEKKPAGKSLSESLFVKPQLNQIETGVARPMRLIEKTITGQVTDLSNGEGLPGVNILAKGTTNGTVTNVDGNYRLTVGDEVTTLAYSSIGYETLEEEISGRSVINMSLAPDIQALDEVVVIGYGSVKKSDLTGSVSSVEEEEIKALPNPTVEQALQGRSAGVQVTKNSASPGGEVSVRIRGGNSIIGNNDPLYVVDGFPISQGGISAINPNNIASMEVLKDASATAIYGSRGANGVILITTKSGREGRTTVDVEVYGGVQEAANILELLNSEQYAQLANEVYSDNPPNLDNSTDTNWQEEILRTALIANTQVTIRGGTEKTLFSVSGNYFKQDGIVISSDFDRASLNLKLDHNINPKVKIGTSLFLSRTSRNSVPTDGSDQGPNSLIGNTWKMPPTLPVRNPDGSYSNPNDVFFTPRTENPVAFAVEPLRLSTQNRILGNTFIEYSILDGLSLKMTLGVDYSNDIGDTYIPTTLLIGAAAGGSGSVNHIDRNSYLNENLLTYERNLNENNRLSINLGYTWQQDNFRRTNTGASGFISDRLENRNLQAGENVGSPTTVQTQSTLLSVLSRINYIHKERYLFTFTGRADGSSKFGDNNKWGVFPSGAFAWRLSEEGFLNDSRLINDLKLRTSYGVTGSQAISPYESLSQVGVRSYSLNGVYVVGQTITELGNPSLKWEETRQFDVGADLSMFGGRLNVTVDYYSKNTNDLLALRVIPTTTGFSSILDNIGSIDNKGVELFVGGDIFVNTFKWSSSLNASINRNEVKGLGEAGSFFGGGGPGFSAVSYSFITEGEPLGMFYGFIDDGVDPQTGDIVYRDISGEMGEPDGEITDDDRTIIGNPYPDFIFGINNNLSYRNLSLNIFLQGVYGNEIFNASNARLTDMLNDGNNQLADIWGNYWKQPGDIAKYPRASTDTDYRPSTRFIEDGSFLRLKNVKLSYQLLSTSSWFQNLNIYVSAQNLFTLTNYSSYDPEVSTLGGNLRPGVDSAPYPTPRSYVLGLNIQL